jgi:hypothetical protein
MLQAGRRAYEIAWVVTKIAHTHLVYGTEQ